jgi:ribosomal protein L14
MSAHTKFSIVDNSGVRSAKCIKVVNGGVGFYGKIVVVAIKRISVKEKNKALVKSKSRLVKGEVVKGFVIVCKRPMFRPDGRCISFSINGIAILTNYFKSKKLFGTRLFIPVLREYRNMKMLKLITVSSKVI